MLPQISQIDANPLREVGYRRGYSKGASAVVDAVETHLTNEQALSLREWLARLPEWQGFATGLEHEPPPVPRL